MSEIDWSKAPEWDGQGARPESGQICEMETDTSDWQTVLIKYISHDGVVAEIMNGMEAFISCARKPKFRPLQTPEERQKEELVNHCVMTIGCGASHEQVAAHMYEIIKTNFNLTEK